jgi:L-threonylcarbamoyladenylate synthase
VYNNRLKIIGNMLESASKETMDRAVSVLKKGGLVAFPTDTVYCLGADPFNEAAVKKIFAAKKRPDAIALPVIVADFEQLKAICELSSLGRLFAEELFPVGFTLILPKLSCLPDIITAGKPTVAVRIQAHPVAAEIAKKLGRGVAGTSANIHTMKSPVTGSEVEEQLGNTVDLIVDGVCDGGVESTIVDITSGQPVIIRHGAISDDRIESVWQKYKKRVSINDKV